MTSPISVKVEPPDLACVAAGLAKASPELRREFGKEMRKIAKTAVTAERQAVLGLSSKARHTRKQSAIHAANQLRGRKKVTEKSVMNALQGAGLRKSISNSINAIIRYQGTDVGVRIRAQSSKMPRGMERLPALTNKGQWSHPIMGKGGPGAVTQTTSPAQWWWKGRDQAARQAQRDFERLLHDYANKIASNTKC